MIGISHHSFICVSLTIFVVELIILKNPLLNLKSNPMSLYYIQFKAGLIVVLRFKRI